MMKKYKKLTLGIAVSIICILTVFGFSSESEKPTEQSETLSYPANVSSGQKSGEEEKQEDKCKYYITLEGDALCAYLVENGETELLRSEKAVTLLMSEDEISMLSRGIYAESYEDLWMYFESYSS
ncbi:MAG: hypothetical protein E7395_04305 [Ruminococcaceae bacterium]|nr:hypothetical protein [Oscillospiraceae bacterium]